MSEKLNILQKAFEVALESNSNENLEIKNLDELLRTQAFDEQPGSPILRMIAALPAKGYQSLSKDEKEFWLRRALATIRYEKQSSDPKNSYPNRKALKPKTF